MTAEPLDLDDLAAMAASTRWSWREYRAVEKALPELLARVRAAEARVKELEALSLPVGKVRFGGPDALGMCERKVEWLTARIAALEAAGDRLKLRMGHAQHCAYHQDEGHPCSCGSWAAQDAWEKARGQA
jgi:hypothetical protein